MIFALADSTSEEVFVNPDSSHLIAGASTGSAVEYTKLIRILHAAYFAK